MSNLLISCISLLMIVTSFVVVEWRRLSGAVHVYQLQSILIAVIFALYAISIPNPALFFWAGTVLVSKGIIVPLLLRRYIVKDHGIETSSMLNPIISLVIGVALAMSAFFWVYAHHAQLAALPSLAGEPYRTNMAVAAAIFVASFYALLTRRDAFKSVMGLCLLENAIHLGLVSLAPAIPETAMIGVITDVVISIWLLLVIVASLYRTTGSVDTFNLRKLRG